jgi:hypothetical protein
MDGNFRCAASPDERAVLQGLRWNISCQVRSCKRKCFGPAASAPKIPWSAEKIAAKFPSWVECTTCSNDLPGKGRRNQLLGGWGGSAAKDTGMNGILLKPRHERLLQFLTGWYYRSKWKNHAQCGNRRPKGAPRWCIPRFNGGQRFQQQQQCRQRQCQQEQQCQRTCRHEKQVERSQRRVIYLRW